MTIYRNWKDPAEYEFTEDLSLLGWAWEFLRRNKEYQRDWLIELKEYFSGERVQEDIRIWREVTHTDIANERMLWINGKDFSIHPKNAVRLKYGVQELRNPKQDHPFFLSTMFQGSSGKLTFSGYHFGGNLEEFYKKHSEDRYPAVMFDLELPIQPQIERIKDDLLFRQKMLAQEGRISPVSPKNQKDKWRDYLRIIDAKNSPDKPPVRKIAAVLYPREDNIYPDYRVSDKIKKSHKAAIELVNFGYRTIAMMGLANPPKPGK